MHGWYSIWWEKGQSTPNHLVVSNNHYVLTLNLGYPTKINSATPYGTNIDLRKGVIETMSEQQKRCDGSSMMNSDSKISVRTIEEDKKR